MRVENNNERASMDWNIYILYIAQSSFIRVFKDVESIYVVKKISLIIQNHNFNKDFLLGFE